MSGALLNSENIATDALEEEDAYAFNQNSASSSISNLNFNGARLLRAASNFDNSFCIGVILVEHTIVLSNVLSRFALTRCHGRLQNARHSYYTGKKPAKLLFY